MVSRILPELLDDWIASDVGSLTGHALEEYQRQVYVMYLEVHNFNESEFRKLDPDYVDRQMTCVVERPRWYGWITGSLCGLCGDLLRDLLVKALEWLNLMLEYRSSPRSVIHDLNLRRCGPAVVSRGCCDSRGSIVERQSRPSR